MSDIDNNLPTDCLQRFRIVQQQVADAANKAGRSPDDITIVAVSKQHSMEMVKPLLDYGHCVFGENRVQEAADKWSDVLKCNPEVQLHLIGPLQTNKVKDAVGLFDVIHSLDRPKLASKLSIAMMELNRTPELFVQVNTGEEPQKAGVLPLEADDFIRQCLEDHDLKISGLMCIPPADEEPSLHFALLAKIADRCGLEKLSMGMTNDFEKAIAFGATHIRVGSAIFGPRPA